MLVASRNNLLWKAFNTQVLDRIIFPQCRRREPRDGPFNEFMYQRSIDRLVERYMNDIVHNNNSRLQRSLQLSRIGLRASKQLKDFLSVQDSTYLRHRYYSLALLKAISLNYVIIQFCKNFDKGFDIMDLFLLLETATDRDREYRIFTENSFADDFKLIKSDLQVDKYKYSEQLSVGSYLDQHAREAAVAVSKALSSADLLHDYSVERPFSFENSPLRLRLDSVFDRSSGICQIHKPAQIELSVALYYYFAKWMGLEVSLIIVARSLYVRIKDPHPKKSQDGYFFIDPGRAGKLREYDEMLGICTLAHVNPVTALQPASISNIIHQCYHGYLNLGSRNYELDFMYPMLFFLIEGLNRLKQLNIDYQMPEEYSDRRIDFDELDEMRNNFIGIALEKSDFSTEVSLREMELDYRPPPLFEASYTEVVNNATGSISMLLFLTEFIFPLAPSMVAEEEKISIITNLNLALRDDNPVRVYSWGYSVDNPEIPLGSIVSVRGQSLGVILNCSIVNENIFYQILFENESSRVSRPESIVLERFPSYQYLVERNPYFFAIFLGRFCSHYNEEQGRFELIDLPEMNNDFDEEMT